MKIVGFIWLEEIVDKLEVKHQVTPEEVEQVLVNDPLIRWLENNTMPIAYALTCSCNIALQY